MYCRNCGRPLPNHPASQYTETPDICSQCLNYSRSHNNTLPTNRRTVNDPSSLPGLSGGWHYEPTWPKPNPIRHPKDWLEWQRQRNKVDGIKWWER